jgi:hypothetical protein
VLRHKLSGGAAHARSKFGRSPLYFLKYFSTEGIILRKRLGLSVTVVAAISLFFWGCGSDDGASGSAQVSKAAFVRQANAVCEAASERIVAKSATAEQNGKTGPQAGAELVPVILVPAIEEEIEEVRALEMPEGDEAQIEAILDALQEVMDKAKVAPEEFLAVLGAGERPYRKVEKLANAYGIDECAQP